MDSTSLEQVSAEQQRHQLLLTYLRDNDASCPVCRYNLRGLTRPTCPECRQQLALSVCAPDITIGWLFVAIAPGFFSGIAAFFMCFPTIGILLETGSIVRPLAGAVFFGWISGLFAIVLSRRRNNFIALPRRRQQMIAIAIWLIHFAALVVLVFALDPYI